MSIEIMVYYKICNVFFILLLLRFYTLIKIKIELSIDNPIFYSACYFHSSC